MLSDSFTIVNKAVSAVAETGQVAVTSPQTFRQLANADKGRIVRTNSRLGSLTISQTPTKEVGAGGKRTLFRFDLKANGLLPAASAYVVLTSSGVLSGPARTVEAFGLLMSSLLTVATQENTADTGLLTPLAVSSDAAGFTKLVVSDENVLEVDITSSLNLLLERLVNGEA